MTAELWRILRFLAVGLLNTGFGYLCYAAIVLTGAPLWLAVSAATAAGILFNFMSYGQLVFGTTSRLLLPRFLGLYAALGVLNFTLLHFLSHVGLGPLAAQAGLLPLLALLSYSGMRNLVFS